jgi:hypothetical protein
MEKINAFLLIFTILAMIALPIPIAKAQSRTLIVPDVYSTIGEAIGNATDGDIVFVKNGIYNESMLIVNKSISLVGEDIKNTIVYLNPPKINVTVFTVTFEMSDNSIKITADNFRLSNLSFYSPNVISSIAGAGGICSIVGNGIRLIENSFSTGMIFSGSGAIIANNHITDGKLELNGSNNTLKENTINAVETPAVSCKGAYNVISGNNASGSTSFYVEGYSNILFNNTLNFVDGLDLDGTECVIAKNNMSVLIILGSNNTVFGNVITKGLTLWCRNSSFYGNYFSLDFPIGWKNDRNNLFYHNNFGSSFALRDKQEITQYYWDNGKEGNYWQNYIGHDSNGDGIGDEPYRVTDNTTDRYPLMAPFNVSSIVIEFPEWIRASLTNEPAPLILPSQPAASSSTGIQGDEQSFLTTVLLGSIIGVTALILVFFVVIRYVRKSK